MQLHQHTIVILFGNSLREATSGLDERLESPVQQLIHFVVVIIVVANAIDALDVVPDGSAKLAGVNVLAASDRVIG